MYLKIKFSLWLLLLAFIINCKLQAGHIGGAYMGYTCLGQDSVGLDIYEIKLEIFRVCGLDPAPQSVSISYSSSSCAYNLMTIAFPVDSIEITPICSSTMSDCKGGFVPGSTKYIYVDTITLPMACNDWVFSWDTCCRNASITTINLPSFTPIYIDAFLDNLNAPCNSSPSFSQSIFSFLCAGQPYIFTPIALEMDGDSLNYRTITAMINKTDTVDYLPGYSRSQIVTSVPPMTHDNLTGEFKMDPTVNGEITVLAFRISEYRNGSLVGYITADLWLSVNSCANTVPLIDGINGTNVFVDTVDADVPFCIDIYGSDANGGQTLTMSWKGGLSNTSFSTTGINPDTATFCWTPTVADVGLNHFVVSIRDDACPYNAVQTYSFVMYVVLGSDISGTVFNDNTSDTIKAGEVVFYEYVTPPSPMTILTSTTINSDGSYSINLPHQDYLLVANPDTILYPNAINTYFPKTIFWDSADVFSLTGDTTGVDIFVQGFTPPGGPGRLAGRIEHGNYGKKGPGDPYDNVNIVVVDKSNGSVIQQSMSGSGGNFSLNNLPLGTFSIYADVAGIPNESNSYDITSADTATSNILATVDSTLISYSIIPGVRPVLPDEYGIGLMIYPNPYKNTTTISYNLPERQHVLLEIYNMLGEKVNGLVDETQQKGEHFYTFSAKSSGYSAGVYLLKLKVNGTAVSRMLIQLR